MSSCKRQTCRLDRPSMSHCCRYPGLQARQLGMPGALMGLCLLSNRQNFTCKLMVSMHPQKMVAIRTACHRGRPQFGLVRELRLAFLLALAGEAPEGAVQFCLFVTSGNESGTRAVLWPRPEYIHPSLDTSTSCTTLNHISPAAIQTSGCKGWVTLYTLAAIQDRRPFTEM